MTESKVTLLIETKLEKFDDLIKKGAALQNALGVGKIAKEYQDLDTALGSILDKITAINTATGSTGVLGVGGDGPRGAARGGSKPTAEIKNAVAQQIQSTKGGGPAPKRPLEGKPDPTTPLPKGAVLGAYTAREAHQQFNDQIHARWAAGPPWSGRDSAFGPQLPRPSVDPTDMRANVLASTGTREQLPGRVLRTNIAKTKYAVDERRTDPLMSRSQMAESRRAAKMVFAQPEFGEPGYGETAPGRADMRHAEREIGALQRQWKSEEKISTQQQRSEEKRIASQGKAERRIRGGLQEGARQEMLTFGAKPSHFARGRPVSIQGVSRAASPLAAQIAAEEAELQRSSAKFFTDVRGPEPEGFGELGTAVRFAAFGKIREEAKLQRSAAAAVVADRKKVAREDTQAAKRAATADATAARRESSRQTRIHAPSSRLSVTRQIIGLGKRHGMGGVSDYMQDAQAQGPEAELELLANVQRRAADDIARGGPEDRQKKRALTKASKMGAVGAVGGIGALAASQALGLYLSETGGPLAGTAGAGPIQAARMGVLGGVGGLGLGMAGAVGLSALGLITAPISLPGLGIAAAGAATGVALGSTFGGKKGGYAGTTAEYGRQGLQFQKQKAALSVLGVGSHGRSGGGRLLGAIHASGGRDVTRMSTARQGLGYSVEDQIALSTGVFQGAMAAPKQLSAERQRTIMRMARMGVPTSATGQMMMEMSRSGRGTFSEFAEGLVTPGMTVGEQQGMYGMAGRMMGPEFLRTGISGRETMANMSKFISPLAKGGSGLRATQFAAGAVGHGRRVALGGPKSALEYAMVSSMIGDKGISPKSLIEVNKAFEEGSYLNEDSKYNAPFKKFLGKVQQGELGPLLLQQTMQPIMPGIGIDAAKSAADMIISGKPWDAIRKDIGRVGEKDTLGTLAGRGVTEGMREAARIQDDIVAVGDTMVETIHKFDAAMVITAAGMRDLAKSMAQRSLDIAESRE